MFRIIATGMQRITLVGVLLISHSAHAAPWDSLFQGERKIQVRTGVTVRNIQTDFTLAPLSSTFLSSLLSDDLGRGNVGFYDGGTAPVVYDDGQVGLDQYGVGMGIPTGLADFIVNRQDQVVLTSRMAVAEQVSRMTFSTTGIDLSSLPSGTSRFSDDDVAAGAFLEFACPLDDDEEDLNFVIGYYYYDTEHHGEVGVEVTNTTYYYSYDVINGLDPSMETFPLDTQGGMAPYSAVYDTFLAGSHPGSDVDPDDLLPPSLAMEQEVIPFLVCVADLNVTLHEVPIGLEREFVVGDTKFFCMGGISLNFFDYELTSSLRDLSGNTLYSTKDSGTPFRLGAYAGINCVHPLNDDGSVFLTAHATYRWVDSFSASAGHASVEVDASSFEGGIGIGFILQ